MNGELSALPEDGDKAALQTTRAELLRLTGEHAALEKCNVRLVAENRELRRDGERARGDRVDEIRKRVAAEVERDVLRERIAEAPRREVALAGFIDGDVPCDLALCRVALVKLEAGE